MKEVDGSSTVGNSGLVMWCANIQFLPEGIFDDRGRRVLHRWQLWPGDAVAPPLRSRARKSHFGKIVDYQDCMDLLMHVYKNEFQNLGGYLVDTQKVDDKKGSYIKLKRVERFILAVGAFEEQIFAKRSIIRENKLRRILNDYREAKEHEMSQLNEGTSSYLVGMHAVVAGLKISDSAVDPDTVLKNTKELKQKLKENT
ncbi:hypothetical protein ACS0TY_020722 [Phlomoides rotata]